MENGESQGKASWEALDELISYACGMVVLKMSSMQLQVLSQVSGLNFSPFRMTTFSRQLVPDLASCSLSAMEPEQMQDQWDGVRNHGYHEMMIWSAPEA